MKLSNWFQNQGRWFLAIGREMRGERGAMDIGGILIMGIGMVFLAVGFIMYPVVMTGTDALLAYWCAVNETVNATGDGQGYASINASFFTGFTPIVGITPLLVLVGYLSAAVFSMYLGVKVMKGGAGGTKIDLGTMLLLGISMIFIAIGLIILPVTLDAICSVLSNNSGGASTGQGLSATYTGLGPILTVTPLLILIAFVAGAVVSGFFGLRRIGQG